MPTKNKIPAILASLFSFWILFVNLSCKDAKVDALQANGNAWHLQPMENSKDSGKLLTFLAQLDSTQITKQTLNNILLRSKTHDSLGQQDSVLFYDRLLLKYSSKTPYREYIAKARSYLAYDHRITGSTDSAYYYYDLAQKSYKELNDSLQVGRKLLEMGKIQFRLADYHSSKQTITEAIPYLDPINNASYTAIAMNELAHNFSRLADILNAEKYYRKAISIDSNTENKALYTNNLALLYQENGQYEKAITLFKELLKNLPDTIEMTEKARFQHNLAFCEWKLYGTNPIGKFTESLGIRKKAKDTWGLLSSYSGFMDYYLDVKDPKGRFYADSLIQISRLIKNPNAELSAIQNLLTKNKATALDLIPRFLTLNDSITKNRLSSKNQFAYLKYQDQQEKEQLLTFKAETAEQKATLIRQQTQKILLLVLFVVMLLVSFSMFYYLKQRHQKEKLQEIYRTEKRISKVVHDELANDLYGLMTSMEHTKNFEKTSVLDRLENIYNRTRDISHETGGIDTLNYTDELKKLLSQFRNDDTVIALKDFNTIKWKNLEDEIKITLYRVLNELLVNMKKHSGASVASISFKQVRKKLAIGYADNGKGLKTPFNKGLGLSNTETRIKNLNGTISFDSELGKGTKITISFPI
ncbi:tetratricopeptide repeat protein [Maribacter chungangensis]|uniref:histidine kinase n=1 Tax=Maribacter chungangensis TaxID=1069117 RepID=A0ABW3B1R0_9FLAO